MREAATRTPGSLQLCLIGTPRLQRADGSVHALERKDAALLALLALDGPTHRARAAALLWPDLGEAQARSNLRQRLFRLRRSAEREVVASASLLRLTDEVTLDLAELQARLLLDPAAGQGDLLSAHDYADQDGLAHWVEAARERWRATRLNLLAQVASDLEARQQIAAALPYAQRMLADEPLLEHAHRRLMRLHYLRGDRAAALAAFEACREALGGALGLRPSSETIALARLIESSGPLAQPAPAPRPIAALRPPRLVGRDAEWQRLERRFAQGAAALVVGEAGIGKTRLIDDFAAARAGDKALFSGARPGDALLPYALLGRLGRGLVQRFGPPRTDWAGRELARIAPELAAAASDRLEPLRLQQAVVEALVAWHAAGLALLAIDDLQFADAATLDMLPALVAFLGSAQVPCLLGVRANEMPPGVRAWIAGQDDDAVERIALGPLELPGVRALLDSLAIEGLDAAQWAGPLARHTGGNPLYILETLIALLDRAQPLCDAPPDLPAPAHVGALIERRLSQLSPAALKLARLAAIAGQDFGVELAAAVLGQHALDIADHWRELEAALIIRDAAFAHDLIFEATLRSVPPVVARALHREVAAHLQARDAAPARLAVHWEQAGEWGAAGAACDAAARAAMAASRRAEEATLWQRAAACHERAGDRAAAFRSRCAGVKAVMAARPLAEAQVMTERLLAEAQGDAERLDALLERSTLLLLQHDTTPAEVAAGEALELARRLGLPWHEFHAARSLALALAQRKRGAEGVALLGRFEAVVEADGSLPYRFAYWSDMAYVLNDANRRREAARAWQSAAEIALAIGDRHEAVTCTSNLAIMLAQLGRPGEAHEHAQRAQRLQADLGHADDVVASAADMNVASFGLLLGHYGQALALFESALRRFRQSNAAAWIAACEHNLASTWLQLGQIARAMQALTPIDPAVPPTTRARRLVIEGRIERVLRRTALPRLRQALALIGERGDPFQRVLAELDESRELEPAAAIAQCRRCADRAGELELLGGAMKARLFELEALLRAGEGAAAAGLARETRERLADCRPVDMHWAEVLWLLSRAFDAGGDATRALEALDEAVHWIRLEALPHVPEPFRDAFLHRQPVNVAVLAAAGRRLPARGSSSAPR